jgi:hypothetical protein
MDQTDGGERDLNIFLAGSICGRPSVARGMADLRRAIDPESIASGNSLADSPPVIGGPWLYGDLIGEEENKQRSHLQRLHAPC